MKFEAESLFIVCLVESGAEFTMYGHGCTDNSTGEVFAEVWMFDRFHEIAPREVGETQEFCLQDIETKLSRLSSLLRCKIVKVRKVPLVS